MIKKLCIAILTALCLLSLAACSVVSVVHCDGCGKEIRAYGSNMTEDWIILCEDCQKLAEELAESD